MSMVFYQVSEGELVSIRRLLEEFLDDEIEAVDETEVRALIQCIDEIMEAQV